MREKLETLPVAELREIAKANGIKNLSTMRKGEIIDRLVELGKQKQEATGAGKEVSGTTETLHSADNGQNAGENVYDKEPAAQTVREVRNNSYKQRTMQSYARQSSSVPPENIQKAQTNTPHTQNVQQSPGNPQEQSLAQNQEATIPANGILEVMPDGFGFIRCDNFLPGEDDVYVSPYQVRRFNLKTGDILSGRRKAVLTTEKFAALTQLDTVNGLTLDEIAKRKNFEDLTPVFPHERIRLSKRGSSVAMRVVDLISPIGKGQRGMIVSQPKAGKTTLLKQIAKAIISTNKDMHLIILLIDERPEEVTDMKETIKGENVDVIYSTFDELPERHKRVSEMVIERAKRLVEQGSDVTILLDSITRLARAYNLTIQPSGRTLSGGLDPASLHMPKKFFGAARCMREGGSLTILATALVDTGSKMDDVVYEEFKGTGNMELVLDRKLSEKRIFPAIDIAKSGTRNENLLLSRDELEAMEHVRRALNGMRQDEAVERILDTFVRTKDNEEFVEYIKKTRII